DAAPLREATALGHVGLDHVDRPFGEERLEGLAARQDLAGGDEDGRSLPELLEAGDVVGPERLLEPDDAVVTQHLGSLARPRDAVRPELLAPTRVHHELDLVAHGLARGLDQELVELPAHAAERAPSHLDRAKAARPLDQELIAEDGRVVEQDRRVRLDTIPVVATEEARDRLAERLALEVPERDVDA